MSTIPEKVDVIIIGTGLTNSIIAAACSRIGKSVLHLDENNYYGNDFASFTFQQLIDWIKVKYPSNKSLETVPTELLSKSRMFCVDLAPRFLYSDGDMVNLLVKSNVARYHEFKNNIRILCLIDDDVHVLPCRRNDVFTSPLLSDLLDKRRLMKFVEFCMRLDPEKMTPEQEEICNIPIKQYLDRQKLSENLQEYVINSIAMVRPFEETREACAKIKKFMIATERYGKSPFLFPLYGCGEFPQSFCRLSAVFGGIYCLNTKIKNVEIQNQTTNIGPPDPKRSSFSVKFSDEDHIVTSNILVADYAKASDLKLLDKEVIKRTYLSRAILFTRDSIVNEESSDGSSRQEMASFLRIPPGKLNQNVVYLVELNSSVLVCPKDINVLYLWTRSSQANNPEEDLTPTVENLFKSNKESIIWEFYYDQLSGVECGSCNDHGSLDGFIMTKPSSDDIDYASNITEAATLFKQMFPDQEFLPRAPDPDEIINTE